MLSVSSWPVLQTSICRPCRDVSALLAGNEQPGCGDYLCGWKKDSALTAQTNMMVTPDFYVEPWLKGRVRNWHPLLV